MLIVAYMGLMERYIGQYLGFTNISVSAKMADIIGLNRSWQNANYILHASRQLVQESTTKQVKTVILQQHYQVRFHKQTDKIDHGACVSCHNRNKSINRRFRNAQSHHVQVLCRNKLPLYFRKFSQHEKFDWHLGAEVQAMPSLAQINLKKLAWKMNCVMLSNIYEYYYKCNHYSLRTTTVAMKQLHVIS